MNLKNTESRRFFIYALCYPHGVPFYFGKTVNFEHRIAEHIEHARTAYKAKHAWDRNSIIINALIKSGQTFGWKCYLNTSDAGLAERMEKRLIESTVQPLSNHKHCPKKWQMFPTKSFRQECSVLMDAVTDRHWDAFNQTLSPTIKL